MKNKKLERLKNAKKRKRLINIIIVVFVVFGFCYIKINPMQKSKESEAASQIDEQTENTAVDEVVEVNSDVAENITDVQEIVENVVVEEECEEVKSIIDKYREKQNLTEDNFAFFYYNPHNLKYYFYNENTFFTAASTIKVPLAMIYYDKINNGDLSLDSELQYKSWQYEAGTGKTASTYNPGENIKLSFLSEQMIVNSDNTATNILKEGLGGEKAYRILIKQYTKRDLPDEFNDDNVTSAGYSYDVIKRLYENQDKYADLINYMKQSSGGGYLKKNIETVEIAHKYGSYEGNVHDYGICYTDNEYLIGVFTKDINGAEDLIADINNEIINIKP